MLKKIQSYGMILNGCALTAAAFSFIILPQNFVAGGVTGLAIHLQKILPFSLSAVVFLLNALLFIAGWLCIGMEFVLKSALTSVFFPIMLDVLQPVSIFSELSSDPLLSALLAGGLLGAGTGMVLLGNGSCGGFDTLGIILHKYFRVPVSAVMFCCDFFVITAHAAANPLMQTIYGVLVVFLAGIVTNQLLSHGKSSAKVLIFSPQYEKIREELLHNQDVGMTFIDGETGYLRTPIKVIVTVIPYNKINAVKHCIYQIDPSAFLLMETARYVGGRGYTLSR